ncbi:unnamed protein product [Rotaria sordida]|uniref:Uncharacterized protein n=1 Tax=Rotaria sordida TaxID=392033 RepID=A0A815GTB2_9BILA|nr:unnamed protein product [Rotaria sordida]
MGCTQSHSGMLYVICNDLLITGATLTRKQLYAGYKIVPKDSLQDKAHALVAEASLTLSLLCDLINFCGSATECYTSTKTASAAKKRRKISSSRAQNYAAAVDDTSIVHTEASFITPQVRQ